MKKVLFGLTVGLLLLGCSELDTKNAASLEQETCASCHAVPPATAIHEAEVSCGVCHTGYSGIGENFTVNPALHMNGVKDVSCTGCHAAPPATTVHASVQAVDAAFSCTLCHTGYSIDPVMVNAQYHMNNTIDLVYDTAWLNQRLDTASALYEKPTCSAIACHELPTEGGLHGLTDSASYGYSCTTCHTGYAADTVVSVNPLYHANGVVDVQYEVSWGETGGAMEGNTCSNIACHGGGRENLSGIVWNSTSTMGDSVGCQTCHNTASEVGDKHKGGNTNCAMCHSRVVEQNAGVLKIKDYTKHINGSIDF